MICPMKTRRRYFGCTQFYCWLRESVTAADVHNAWAAWMASKDGDHEALVPFHELSRATIDEDQSFVAAIRAVAQVQS